MRTHEKKLQSLILAMHRKDKEMVDIILDMPEDELKSLIQHLGLLYLARITKDIRNGR